MTVAVVTDSTAYLSPAELQRSGVRAVSLQVVIGGRPHDEAEVPTGELARALRAYVPISTSSPAPRAFATAYAAAAAAGATQIVSIHLSGKLSGTHGAAELAARAASVPVHVVDSGLLGMGLGFCVLGAARLAAGGAPPEEIVAATQARTAQTSTFFYVATLEHLRRGGRMGAAQALLGSALSVKPLLRLRDGRIESLEKVRTAARAMSRLEELCVERCEAFPGRRVDLAVQHLDDPAGAQQLAARLQAKVPSLAPPVVREVGAVVGAHVGPGLVAVAVSPRPLG